MQFANKTETVLKWVLNRPYQTKFLESLVEMSGSYRTTTNNRRLLHPCAFHFVEIQSVFFLYLHSRLEFFN